MKIEQWPIDDVKPYPKNPRINDAAVEAVAQSIKAFGFKQPIVVDKKGVIIVGHTRWKAANRLMLDTVPVLVAADLTAAQVKAYRLADNRTSDFAEWDASVLAGELEGLPKALDALFAELHFDDVLVPTFEPVDESEQPRLDQKSPITCPHCGKDFVPK